MTLKNLQFPKKQSIQSEIKCMDSLISNKNFRETLLRLYLGKYENRFYQKQPELGIELVTKSSPMLGITLILPSTDPPAWHQNSTWITLCEYIKIEKDDPYYNYFRYYSHEIVRVPVEDPEGIKKVEEAVTKLLIVG